MMRALYTAATGMRAEQTNVDTIANNLSNVNTTGFKGQRTEFKSLLYQTIQTRSTSGNGDAKPVGAQVGLGTRVAATTSTYTQGALNSTERPTDFALEGDGFFAVRGTDNQTYYTRMVPSHGASMETDRLYLLIRRAILSWIQTAIP